MSTPIDDTVINGWVVTDGDVKHREIFNEPPTAAEVNKLAFRWRKNLLAEVRVYYFQAHVTFSDRTQPKR